MGSVIHQQIEEEVKKSYLDYAMSVIVSRALPDVRDGLKPVHRRILYAMYDMGNLHNKPYRKSARIVGEVLGKYHPHGDSAVYDAMVRMAQEFSLRYPVIDGQGNMGSIDGDSPAAMRYTEARLNRLAEEMLEDIDKDTVDFVDNFDGSLKEPVVLPAKLPFLLVNGVSGIAVGMATNIPPHNLREVCDAIVMQVDNPDVEVNELISVVKGPDFPTGGTIIGKQGIYSAYAHGKGKVKVRSKSEVKDNKIIITEIPYAVNKSHMIMEIASKVKDKIIEGISDIKDESDRRGIRVVITIKKGIEPEYVLNQLYKYTSVQVTFGINMLALVDNQPKMMGLKEIIGHFISHRKEVVVRRTKYELKKAEERKHILEGLIIALDNIDDVVKKIKESKDTQTAMAVLMNDYSLTEVQAKAILDMKLSKLANLEQSKIRNEHRDLIEKIKEYNEILSSDERVKEIIKNEVLYIRDKYGDERRTEIVEGGDEDIVMEDLIKEDDVVVTITNKGYVKRTSLEEYRLQGRGGKGVTATKTVDDDFVKDLFVSHTHNYILIFTDKGKVYWLKVYRIPEGGRTAKGKPIINLIPIEKDEKVNSIIPIKEFSEESHIVLVTRNGIIKKTSLMNFSRPRKTGIIASILDDNDAIVNAVLVRENDELVIATANGVAARIREKDIRNMGRATRGVIGIRLNKDDYVVGMIKVNENDNVLTLSERGYGKRTPVADYRLIGRGGKGVINFKVNEKTGKVASIHRAKDEDELMLVSRKGISIRIPVKDISIIGRNTQGVRVMKCSGDDVVVSSAVIRNSI